jgi:putative transposase
MQTYESLKHTTWECKYHVVFIPKCRRKVLYQGIRQELGTVFRSLAEQWECQVEEGHLMPDHVHMLLSVPPKYSVSNVMGFIKGKRLCPADSWKSVGGEIHYAALAKGTSFV